MRTHVVAVALLLGWAGSGAAQVGPVGDKSHGEEAQIRARQAWFNERRNLRSLERPAVARARAVEQVRAMRGTESSADVYWRPLGPSPMTMMGWSMGNVAGRVAAVAVDPTNENVIYLGAASGGLWKTTDGGTSWAPLFDDIGTQTIGSIFVQPCSPQTVWVGTGEQGNNCWSYFGMGLFRTTDGGATWHARNGSGSTALDLSYVSSVVTSPVDPTLVLAAGESWCNNGGYYYGGVFRSTDSGRSWTAVINGAGNDVLFDRSSPSVIYAGIGRWAQPGDGVYRSTDSGKTWVRLVNGIPYGTAVGRIRLAMAPSDSRTLYALVEASGGASLYKTTDGGDSWSLQNGTACEGQCWYDLCLAVHPTLSSELLVGSIRFAHSADSGATLEYLVDGWGGTQAVHQDTHVLVYSKLDGKRFWVAGDGGLWRTDDAGATFVNLNGNLNITQLYDIAVHPTDPGVVFGGAQDNSSMRRLDGPLWDVTEVTGDGFMNVVDAADPAVVFQTSYPWNGYPSLCKSTTGGDPASYSWLVNQGLVQNEPYPWLTPLASLRLGAGTDTAMFLASNSVYRSSTSEPWYQFDWTKISPNLTGSSSRAVSVITPVEDSGRLMLYAGTSNGRVWRCDDALAPSPVWTNVTGNYPASEVTDIAADPSDPLRVFVTRGEFGLSRLYRSTVGGTTWESVGAGIPDAPANAVAIDPLRPDRVFVGSDVGVFLSEDGGTTFVAAMAGLPLGAVVTDLEVDASPHVLTAGTYGRGAWQADLTFADTLFADGFESANTNAWSLVVP